MKNLKRMLCLTLAFVMLLGMMTMGVSAAPRFTDEDEIVHTEAVERASERGLFVGANGKFMPKGTVNRAQMATIVVKMMYGSEYNVEPHKKVGKFPDTAAFENGWAEGYINLCSKDGIVVGYEDGYFRPGNQVTAAEAVTMILNALKVDTGKEPWPLNVMSKASEMELFAALGEVKSDTVLNRDQLAVIVMAGLDWKDAQKEQPVVPSGGGSSGSSRPSSGGSSSGSGSSSGGSSSNPGGEYGENELPRVPVLDENNALIQPFDVTYPDLFATGDIKYSGEQIMIKLEAAPTGEQQAALKQAGVEQLELMMDLVTAKWYKAQVKGDVTKVMEAVRKLDFILVAEYDYAYETQASIVECTPDEVNAAVQGNSSVGDQWHLRTSGVQKVWKEFERGNGNSNNGNGNPGNNGVGNGNNKDDEEPVDPDVPVDPEQPETPDTPVEEEGVPSAGDGIVVAVIDTGVDYNHEDLKDNIWVNTAEIPDDNKDNDGNGYIDDYYGYNAVANKGSGMDDQGHGTHVAGIIAAANNNIGVVGVAYNAKIMPIKAGMASGYFNQSDIAEAIIYAYKNGADVINMSFGGSASSIAVQDALELAYTRSVLVAAAGNDGMPNQPTDYYGPMPTYPAALTYVLGVMSVDESGTETSYTNWDVVGFNAPEYEVYAPGDQILSTIPGNRYASWSGTSMAAPFVSAVAALIRDEFRDNNTYPTKFVYGQICGTGNQNALCFDPKMHTVNGMPHNLPQIVDVYAAMTEMPRPDVGVTDFTLFDTVGLMGNTKNNGDGVIDAGETFALGFTVRNKWGMSKETTLWVDAKVGQAGMVDPYITIHTENVNIGQVGTYSTADCGKVMEDGAFVGWEKPIYITVSPDCPNDYIFTLNVHLSCENALDEEDTTVYTSGAKYNFDVRRGVILPTVIEEDMTLTADNVYIIPQATLITKGTTVTAQPGTQIQFWGDDPDDAYAVAPIVVLNVEGNFICEGTPENRVRLFPSQRMDRYRVEIAEKGNGRVELLYTDVVNPYFNDNYPISYAEGCEFTQTYPDQTIYYRSVNGGSVSNHYTNGMISVVRAVDCSFYQLGGSYRYRLDGRFEGCLFVDCGITENSSSSSWVPELIDCVMLGNNTYRGDGKGGVTSLGIYDDSKLDRTYTQSEKNPETGVTYIKLHGCSSVAAQRFAEYVGGYLASFNTVEEWNWVDERSWESLYSHEYFATGAQYDEQTGKLFWADGTEIISEVQAALGMTGPSGRGLAWFGVCTCIYTNCYYPAIWTNNVHGWLIEIPAAVEDITQINPDAPARPVWDVDTIHGIWDELKLDTLNDYFRGNAILNRLELEDPTMWFRPQGGGVSAYTKYSLGENYWGTTNELLIQKQMIDFSAGYQQYADLIPDPILTTVPEHLWPVAVNAGVLKDGEVVTTIGNETVTFFVEFNRDMDTEIPLDVRFGSAFPYADYQLEGAWVNARRWEGTTTLTTLIESGYQYFSVDNGRAADEQHKTLYKDWGRFWFEIDTSDALAMTLQGNATDEGIALTWYQDDFDTLAGYNVYRADKDEDAFYQKLNTTMIPFGTEEFFDDTVEPGKVYYYTFTVVKTDLSESSPSGKIRIVSKDTMAPVLYHTPVYQTYAGRNVVITATATDNVALEQVQLHYRVADGEWNTVDMSSLNDSYSAVISGNNVTEAGLSYYVTASDGVSTVSRGSAENPYVIVVQPDPGQQIMGDVDGDGRITLLDALMVLRAANNKILLNAEQFARADLDGDGLHTAAEALKILKYANGEIGSLQM